MSTIKEIVLYAYFHSSAAWRVRWTMVQKGVPFKYEPIHLVKGEQHSEEFLKINPMHQLPAMKVTFADDKSHYLTQSLAMIEFLEEHYPEKSVYPKDSMLRAKSRAIADTISGGIQPLQNMETLVKYTEPLGLEPLSAEKRTEVARWWIGRKLENLEKLVATTAGKYCVGDQLTLADICLVPQMFNARRFGVDTTKFPLLKRIDDHLQELDIYKSTWPHACPDAPPS